MNISTQSILEPPSDQPTQFSQSFQQIRQVYERQKDQKQVKRVQQEQEKENKNKELKDYENFKVQQQKQLIEKQEQQKIISELERKAEDKFGKLEVCFIVDITASMEAFKQQTSDCIFGSVEEIQSKTGRKTSFATVAYQDIAEFQELGNQYYQHEFTEDSKLIVDYLQKLGCSGGNDVCEDIKGGLIQAAKLQWKSKFRIAVLICDAPCHGKKYHDKKCSDDYPNDDIEMAIDLMIKQDIMLIGVQFVSRTQLMIQEFQNIYQRKGKKELFKSFNLQKVRTEDIWKHLIDLIKDSSIARTGTNNNSTKTNEKYEDGVIQALFQQKSFTQLYQDLRMTSEKEFWVQRVDLKAQSFEKMKSIYNLQHNDFEKIQQGNFKFIITETSFDPVKKSTYLMKNMNDPQKHFYVLKKLQQDWVKECRSHLVSKHLLAKFMRELRAKSSKQIPEICYSDLFILQEQNGQNWIAERFQEGEFIKYNNNWGFILPENTIMNQIAQAFTYYTHYISGRQQMVCNIQGVGLQFTNSAICNKIKGEFFDNTDTGEDGQLMYIKSFQDKKDLAREILGNIGITM